MSDGSSGQCIQCSKLLEALELSSRNIAVVLVYARDCEGLQKVIPRASRSWPWRRTEMETTQSPGPPLDPWPGPWIGDAASYE
jgi:hypothetical protein